MAVMRVLLADKNNTTEALYIISIEECNCLLPLARIKKMTTDEGEGQDQNIEGQPLSQSHQMCKHPSNVGAYLRNGACRWSTRPKTRKFNANQHSIVIAQQFLDKSKNYICTITRAKFNPLGRNHIKTRKTPMGDGERELYKTYRTAKLSTYKDKKKERNLKINRF
ncbi:hypothetical protein SARC_09148 [Sphaeroforma arctica JP610]|uniref:Uncharacterized protein n=1 Tax=Sphaeroforma arctica JP610 TaxID=667725 RepID=A0A0L0FNU3_9EUKA|nr:hypothetical protein SARC_09148 [Sphaeroforma arctica JP610]KNC78414.1 hypothetical protein SARC_09148 [Sphaeroforma arctica JP610]|eukprot:XP_014152316.1 hypothetical protein SARC_09148 [Sphaeroforma arctica JP610]